MTVKIVTDSVADLPEEVVDELGITVVPLNVRFGEEVFRDRIDITNDQFYERIKQDKDLPVTTIPTPSAYTSVYDKLAKVTNEILVITVSAKLSGTHSVAVKSIEMMKRKRRVEVIDSGWAVMAQGFLVIKAARAAKDGTSLDEIKEIVTRNKSRVSMCAAFDTLEYLRRGGRIGRAQALLGSLLNINPLITLKDGLVEPAGRERSRAGAIDHLFSFVTSYSNVEEIAVEDAVCPEEADLLAKRLQAKFPDKTIYRSRTTPVIGTHTGPGLLVVDVLGDK